MLNFHRLRLQLDIAGDLRAKENLDLSRPAECSRRKDFDLLQFKSDFLAQFSSQRLFRMFTGFEKSAGDAPAASRAKAMFEK